MHILWVTSEAVPFAKTGGLADVSGALPEALAKRGHQLSVVMPYYPSKMSKLNLHFSKRIDMFATPLWGIQRFSSVHVYEKAKNLTFYFIEHNEFFDRERLYDWNGKAYDDNAERFVFLSRSAMELALLLKWKVDIVHANDWHAAMCCVYLRSSLYRDTDSFKKARSVVTIHNIGYQGVFPKEKIHCTGLGWEYFNYTCLEYYDQLNFLKAGIMTADMVNAVSPTYAEEILSPEFGFSLDPALRSCAMRRKLRGILNGIDVDVWDPEHDPLLPARFSALDMGGKKACRKELQKYFHLPERDNVPLFATISRLADQKGLDVFCDGLEHLLYHQDFQFVVIGSGDHNLENWFHYLADKYPKKLGFYCGYASDQVSHLAEAGADFFVMPSRYEPCGLNQMYSMRYGTLPIVRSTGGLADTVINYNYKNANEARGFVFWDLNPQALDNTICWAAGVKQNQPDDFNSMIFNAMTTDFSWNNTASQYEQMYQDAFK